jgi:hypothetical protein
MRELQMAYWLCVLGAICITIPYIAISETVIEYDIRMHDMRRLIFEGSEAIAISPLYYFIILKLKEIGKAHEKGEWA